ncbi:hypothetical protein CAEBREN_25767 [Caenorhabditis brenneri]|uniref:Ubiquitin-like domain-containing protein n=1 Tax=Caenorhabditis brenneri TaxID=135651 RepID=G0ND18_CAEBE|nr:hypothetical protein CAEBREN_25767 [Caenorhabditis brenneri]
MLIENLFIVYLLVPVTTKNISVTLLSISFIYLLITYKITPTMPMHKLKSHFASQLGIPYENICFMFYEKVVNQNDTAESLHLTNNCTLMAFEIALEKPKVYRVVENGIFI